MLPKSPPLPFTARTRTDLPVNGSRISIFELVLPPPKFVMRRSAPSRFDRYRSSSSGRDSSEAASRASHRSARNFVPAVTLSGTGQLHVLAETGVLRVPPIGGRRLESLGGER